MDPHTLSLHDALPILRTWGDCERILTFPSALSGRMLGALPALIAPIVSTPNAAGSFSRLITTCVSVTRSEEHTSELQSLMRISYAVFCLKKKNKKTTRMHQVGLTSEHKIQLATTSRRPITITHI